VDQALNATTKLASPLRIYRRYYHSRSTTPAITDDSLDNGKVPDDEPRLLPLVAHATGIVRSRLSVWVGVLLGIALSIVLLPRLEHEAGVSASSAGASAGCCSRRAPSHPSPGAARRWGARSA